MAVLESWKPCFQLFNRDRGEKGEGGKQEPSFPLRALPSRREERMDKMRARRRYDAYRFDHVYIEPVDAWDTVIGRDVKCVQNVRTTKGGEMLEIQSFPAYQERTDFLRAKKYRPTSLQQQKVNERNAQKKFILKLNANFTAKDYWGTFGWDFRRMPATEEEALHQVQLFIERINYRLKRQGYPSLRYMYAIERKKGSAKEGEPKIKYHLHIVMSRGLDRDTIEGLWKGGEYPNVRNLQVKDFGGLTGLATYITEQEKGKHRWGQSKGLKPWTRKPMDNYSKFSKAKVKRMAEAAGRGESLKAVFEKAYPGYAYRDEYPAEIWKNEQFGGYYVYCRMYRKHDKEGGETS